MRVIVAGGRDFKDYDLLASELDHFSNFITSCPIIVSGCAAGADKLAEKYADEERLSIRKFPAEWDKYGKSAGYRLNVEMADYAEALVAFWDGKSKGTKHMIDTAINKGLIVKVVKY